MLFAENVRERQKRPVIFQPANLFIQLFSGIRPAVAGLIAAAGWSVMRVALFTAPSGSSLFTMLLSCDIKWLVLFCALLALMQIKPLKKLHPIVYIVFSAVVGIGAGFLGFI